MMRAVSQTEERKIGSVFKVKDSWQTKHSASDTLGVVI